MKEIISSLDIGSSTVKLVVCEVYKNENNVLAVSEVKSKGIKKGLIVNPEETLISTDNFCNLKKSFQDRPFRHTRYSMSAFPGPNIAHQHPGKPEHNHPQGTHTDPPSAKPVYFFQFRMAR